MTFMILKSFKRSRKRQTKREELEELDRRLDEVLAQPIHETSTEEIAEFCERTDRAFGEE